jgi:hypothetical protein
LYAFAMNSRRRIHLAALLMSVLILSGGTKASATVTVISASGGSSLSADTAVNAPTPAWTTLGAITIAEGDNRDFAADTNITLVLSAPAGFEFNTAVTPDITFTAGNDIASAAVAVADATTITLTLTVSSTTAADTLTLGGTTGVQVRPTASSPLAVGKHLYRPSTGGGTASIAGITDSTDGSGGTDFGDLTEIAGAPATVSVETAIDGSGIVVPAQNVAAGSSITVYAVARDAFGNFVANVAADAGGWSLSNRSGGILSGDLVPAGDQKSAAFTGHLVGSANILVTSGALAATNSGLLTVVSGAASKLAMATQPSATGVVGLPFAQQPVIFIEDQYGNLRSDDTEVVTAARDGGTGELLGTTNIAAVGGVVTFTNLAHSMVSDITIAFSSGSLTPATSQNIAVGPGPYSQLLVLLPGEVATSGVAPGKSGSPTAQTAGTAFNVTVWAVDANWNTVSTNALVAITSSDVNATLPADTALVAGTGTFVLTNNTAGNWTVTASDTTHPEVTAATSGSFTVNPGAFAKLQLLMPGEMAASGTTSGKTGTASAQTAGTAFNVTVNAVDANWNPVNAVTDTVRISSSDANAALPADTALVAGTRTLGVTFNTAGSATVTAADMTDDSKTAYTSPSITVNAGALAKLQLLLPGETAAPGTTNGKTGSPSAQTAGLPYSVTVNAVDANWNVIATNDTVAITSSDSNAALPANAALIGGGNTFSLTNKTAGTWTVTASDTTHSGVTASTSPSFTVNPGAFAKLQLLMPGETAAPGTTAGKTGSPPTQTAGASFSITVTAVDTSWNLISTNDTVQIASSDAQATLPADAALSAGSGTFSVTLKTSGMQTITAEDVTHIEVASNTGTAIAVNPATASKLVIATEPSATATAGVPFLRQPVILIEDQYSNVRSNDAFVVTATRSAGAGALLGTTRLAAVGGVATFTNLEHQVATNITIQFTSGALTPTTSSLIAVSAGSVLSQLLVLLPGESAAPGTPTGRMGTPTAQTLGAPFSISISAVDVYWNLINTVTDLVSVTSSDAAALLPANAAFINGTNAFAVTIKSAGSQTLTASDITDGHTTGTSSAVTVNPGPFAQLQLLVPGETAAPWTTTGKTGAPTPQLAGSAFTVTVNAVDANWNLVNTNDVVSITSSDASATLPANAALAGGTMSFSVSLNTMGSSTIMASDVTQSPITASTSPSITVFGVAPAVQSRPVVAIHDSELTRALETLPATGSTPSDPGTTGFQWWPTNWHYFVMPESVKEALRSDGTAYEVVGDVDISSGRLLAANGQPRCPIVISLASEAIRDDEIAQLTSYVAAGGTLLVGSSAFTRNTDGTSRGDFALANQMGVHMVNPSLLNWAGNATFTKTFDNSLISHIPSGVLSWQMPAAADEISWGISPTRAFSGPHAVWQVQPSNAAVIAQGDVYPYLVVKQYGKGTFIYCAAMQPLLGHGGLAPGMYAYGIFRNAIELAFASSKLPVPKLSPWPYDYDAALTVRHDFEDYQDQINSLEESAQFEAANGVKGDYYFCTGTLRVDMTNSPATIASLRRAVTNYGATIGPHNGGLQNPNNPSLVLSNYDYWHWGPDEALDVTPPGYSNGSQYAIASISNAFNDVEGWLSGITNGLRAWVAPYFNATRDASCAIEAQLGIKTSGEQKLGPFPGWVLSTSLQTPGKRYPFISLPVSDWYIGSGVAQSMEDGHTLASVQAAVDFYYNWGALINIYSHSSSAGGGLAGALEGNYITYSMTKPRLWAANAVGVYSWWLARSDAQVIPSYSTDGNESITTLSIIGASDPRTAVEIVVPQPSFYGLQVFTNGVLASGTAYRSSGRDVKLLVGTSVTNAEIHYFLAATTQSDVYSSAQGASLSVPAPGVLGNDLAGLGATLAATLVSGPAHGTLTLNTNGGFSYLPATNFTGVDAFSYQASNGTTSIGTATVTIVVTPTGGLFFDDFSRSADMDPLAPWQVAAGGWIIANSQMQGTSEPRTYGYAYITNNWTDYCVQARVQFPVGAFGGGIGGRVNPLTGARYAAWIYPEGSSGGSSVLRLVKFQNWTTFGYDNSSYTPMQQVSLAGVGTDWHPLKLAFLGDQIAVYFDGNQVMSVTDVESQPYLSGGISLDMWTDSPAYTMSVDDVIVSPLVVADSYSMYENTSLTVPAPGPLGSDTGVYATNLMAVVVNGTTNGTLNLNPNGAFSYLPATNFAGADSFVYQVSDGQTYLGAATVTITVNPAIIVTADNKSRAYGAANPPLTGSIVGLLSGDNITASFSTVADTNSPVGTYPITISLLDPDHKLANYRVITNSGALSVTAASLTVVANDASRSYGVTNPVFSGTMIGIQNGDNITATYVSTATPSSPVGSHPITPTLADPSSKLGNYSVSSTNGTLTVNPALLTGTADPKSRLYGAANPPFTVSYSGFVNGQDSNVVSGTLSGSTPATTNSPVGTYPISVGGQSAPNYTIQYVNSTLTVLPTPLLVAGDNTNRAYGQPNPSFTATISGWVNGENTNALGGALVLTSPAQTNSPVGLYPIVPSGLTSTNYALSFSNGTLTVTSYTLSVTASNQSRMYGAVNPVLTGSLMGVQNGDNITAVYTTVADTNSSVGTYAITPTLVDPSGKLTNYSVTTKSGTLWVNLAVLTVTADPQSRSYGAANPTLTATISGFVNGDTQAATVSGAPLLSTTATPANNTGVYPILVNLGTLSATNYTFAFVNGTLTVNPALLTGTADPKSRLYGAANPPFTVSYSGFVNGQDSNVVSGMLSGSTPATTNSPVGTYPISVGGQSAPNYTIQYVNSTLTVVAAPLLVTGDNTTRAYGQPNPSFTATISGWVNGEDTNVLGGALVLTSPAQTNSPVGLYPIIPDGLTSTNYALSFSNGTLTVTSYALSVTASNQCRTYGAANPALTGSLVGVQNGDNLTAVFTTVADTNSPVGSYEIIPTLVDPSGKLTNYTVSTTNGTLTVGTVILGVTAWDTNKVYGSTQVFAGTEFTHSGTLFNGDTLTNVNLSSAGAGAEATVGGYPIVASAAQGVGLSNYTIFYTNGTLSVGAATLGVTAQDTNKVYGSTQAFAGTEFTRSGTLFNGDTLTNVNLSSAGSGAEATVGGYPIVASAAQGVGLSNYTIFYTNGTLTVGAASLGVTAQDTNKVYGSTQAFAGTEFTRDGTLFNGDTLTNVNLSSAGSGAEATVGGYPIVASAAQGVGLSNYTIFYTNGTLTVGTATLGVTAQDTNKVYGSTQAFAGTEFTRSGTLFNGDTLTNVNLSSAGSGAEATVGGYPIVASAALGIGLSNYTIFYTNGTLTVGTASLGVTAWDTNKVYGSTRTFAGTEFTRSGTLFNGDMLTNVSLSSGGTPASATVGSYPIVASVAQGVGLSNYTIFYTNGTLSVSVAALSVAANNASRACGMANPLLTGTITGIQNGDNIIATCSTTATPGSPAGTYPIVPTLVDPDHKASNYTISSNNGTLTITNTTTPVILSIIPATNGNVVITWTSVSNSIYRVQYRASLGGTNWVNLLPDVVAAGGTASFTDHPAGAAQRYYRVLFVSSAPFIAPVIQSIVGAGTANVVITWSAVSNQVYRVQYKNGLSSRSWFNLAPDVTATNSSASFTDHPSAGTQRYYRVVLLTTPTPLTPLVVVANNASRAYAAGNPSLSGTIAGVQNGDNITATYTTTATAGSPVGAYPIMPSLVDPNGKLESYLVSMTNGTLTVTAAALSVTANNASRAYGATNPTFNGTITGIQNGDNITATYATTATSTSPLGSYPITPTLVDPNGKLANYTVSTTNGTLTVTPSPLTVTANNSSRAYGAANPIFTGTIVGIQNGDNITATYATTATTSSPAGTYPIVPALVDPGSKLTNYTVTLNNGTLSVTGGSAPTILSIARSSNTNIIITWASVSNTVYRVQYKTSLTSTNWKDLAPDVTATASTASFTDYPGTDLQRFYRVVMNPLVTVQPPSTLGIKGNGDGTATVSFAGTPEAQYVVQTATDLAPPVVWMNVSTNTAGADGRWTFTDSTGSGLPRFYRSAKP